MKRKVYLVLFVALGAALGFLIHAVAEIWYLKLLIKDFPKYGLGMTWNNWILLHDAAVVLLVTLFAYWGYRQGKLWWKILYVDQRYKPHGKPLKTDF